MVVDGVERSALVDTGCTRCIAHVSCCRRWRKRTVGMTALNGGQLRGDGVGTVWLQPTDSLRARAEVIVSQTKPLGFDVIIGMNGVKALGGVVVDAQGRASFGPSGGTACAAVQDGDIRLDEPDFAVNFDHARRTWTATWKWGDGKGPDVLKNAVREYPPAREARAPYEEELEKWVRQGWLVPYDEGMYGPAKGLIPLMAVVQRSKEKVRPVMDFRELNGHVETFTANADVCADKLREWRRKGVNLAMVDLNDAYLQVRADQSLWQYQTVVFKGQKYCLTRLGFGLSVAPLVMRTVLNHVLSMDPDVRKGTSAYVDDILVDESVVSAHRVREHLARYGLASKPPERVAHGTRVLGLRVWGERGKLEWARGAKIPSIPSKLTRRSVFSYCGELVGHYPVCGWLRVAAALAKRKANEATSRWDDQVHGSELESMLREIDVRVEAHDPARGRWDATGDEGRVWADASALAMGVALEISGSVVEDAAWLRPDDARHINMAELDAAIKGLNLAISWGLRTVELMTDSATVHRWISNGITGKARLRTKAAGEMLIRRRVDTIVSLVQEYDLRLTVTLVRSAENKADSLTRVPQGWLKPREESTRPVCALTVEADAKRHIEEVHHLAGHPGVRRTLYFVRRSNPAVTRRQVRSVVATCQTCQSVDPAPVRWKPGSLSVGRVWQRLAMDVTHCGGRDFLTLIDSGPSRFAIWRPMRHHSSEGVVSQLEGVFYERGAPEEILADNDTAFRSRLFTQLMTKWDVRLRFRAAYAPSGNGIVERCHRSVKVIVARKRCTVAEAVHLYNVTPKDGCNSSSAPANTLYAYQVRVRGVDRQARQEQQEESPYGVDDLVWVKPPGSRCDTQYRKGTVTGTISDQVVEVDGVPRHVKDLRRRAPSESSGDQRDAKEEEPEWGPIVLLPMRASDGPQGPRGDATSTPTVTMTPASAENHDLGDSAPLTPAAPVCEEIGTARPVRARQSRRCIGCD